MTGLADLPRRARSSNLRPLSGAGRKGCGKPTLVVLTKAPRIGLGKSRLAQGLGRVEAWRINRALQALTFRRARDPRWRIVLCVAPDSALRLGLPGIWPPGLCRSPQSRGDLGARISRALAGASGPVAVIGTDCPDLTPGAIAEVFAGLRRARFAAGPAPDGGFWMLAARRGREVAPIARGVRWSSARTLSDVENVLGPLARGPELADVDTVDEWRRASRPLIGARRAPRPHRASPRAQDRAPPAPL